MEKKQNYKLIIKSEFRRLVLPLNKSQKILLKNKTLKSSNGITFPVWESILLNNFENYFICCKNNIPFDVVNMQFKSTEEAIIWICDNQLLNCEIPLNMRKYLIGKHCLAEKAKYLREYISSRQMPSSKKAIKSSDKSTQIYEQLGTKYNISPSTVKKYSVFAEQIDVVYNISSEFAVRILKNDFKISQENLIVLARLPHSDTTQIIKTIAKDKSKDTFLDFKHLISNTHSEKNNSKALPDIKIKNMPAYDPDAELASLSLTVPSWISSINRTYNVTNIHNTSSKVKEKLKTTLMSLRDSVDIMIICLEEE